MEKPLDWVKIGERLRHIRKESGLSQREFGRRCGVSQNMISLYEKGRSRASVDFYVQVAHLGGKTIEWLLMGHRDHAMETLREMRDLHAKMTSHLAVVHQLLDREADHALDRTILAVDDPDHLREVLRTEKRLPNCLRDLLEDDLAWRALAMTGREVVFLRRLTDVFGDLSRDGIHQFLHLARHIPPAGKTEKPLAPRERDSGYPPSETARALPPDPE